MGHDRCFISIPLFHARDSYSLLSSSLPFPLSLSLILSRSLFLSFSLYDTCRHVWMRNCALARLKALCAFFSSLTRRITENRYWIGLDTAGRREDETRRNEKTRCFPAACKVRKIVPARCKRSITQKFFEVQNRLRQEFNVLRSRREDSEKVQTSRYPTVQSGSDCVSNGNVAFR